MAFVVAKNGRFEIRESHATPKGPRSRTLATFTQLTDDVIGKAAAKASKPIDVEKLEEAARRAGAPVAVGRADQAARELIAALARGDEMEPKLRNLLLDALRGWSGPTPRPDTARSAAEWLAASPGERGKTLVDLLLLADALPSSGRRGKRLSFPHLSSTSP